MPSTCKPWMILLVALAGCEALGHVRVENPVVGPPPPRISMVNDRDGTDLAVHSTPEAAHVLRAAAAPSGEGVVSAGLLDDADSIEGLFGSQTVATVNGAPILASEILDRYATQLAAAAKEVPPAEYRKLTAWLLKRDLDSHVDRTLLTEALRANLKPDQFKLLNEFIDKAFEEELAHIREEMEVNTNHELELELRKQNSSLVNLKATFAAQQMAMEYLRSKSRSGDKISRPDMLRDYHARLDDFAIPARVKWQQIRIGHDRPGGRQKARELADQALAELEDGAAFSEVARRHSDAPGADKGGHWGWTEAANLTDRQLRRVLFELPVGTVSEVLEISDSFQVVRVNERESAGHVPFEKVQDQIRTRLQRQAQETAARHVVEELRQDAVIVTIFDGIDGSGDGAR